MVRASVQAVKCLFEVPILIFFVCWVADRWTDGKALIVRQYGIAKCIFAVALLEDAVVVDGFGHKETEGGVLENWGVAL